MGIFSSRSGISQLHCILMFTSKPEVFFLIINLRLNFVVTKAGNLQIKSVFWFRFLVLSCFSAYVRREVVALFQMTCINEYRLMMIICFLHSFQPQFYPFQTQQFFHKKMEQTACQISISQSLTLTLLQLLPLANCFLNEMRPVSDFFD